MKARAIHLADACSGAHGICGHVGDTADLVAQVTCRACLRRLVDRGRQAQAQLDALNIRRKS